MPTSRSAKLALTVLLLAVLSAAAFLLTRESTPSDALPPLSRADAAALMGDSIQDDCRAEGVAEAYRSCTLEAVREGEGYRVTVTYDGFFDDSVKASRVEATVTWSGGVWVRGAVTETQQCWPDRGHQDFSAELCV